MDMTIRGISYYYDFFKPVDPSKDTLVCLHGFTGTGQTFYESLGEMTAYNVLVIDLLGHGRTSVEVEAERYQMSELCQDIASLITELVVGKCHLLGYSMGARVALALAVTYPELLTSLLLESGSPGLASAEERLLRRQKDEQLAADLQAYPIDRFVDKWENIPLFASQKVLDPASQTRVRKERLSQNRDGLAQSLRQMGTGSQPSYWPALSTLTCPVLTIVGELDSKFCTIAIEMSRQLPTMTIEIVPDTGHCVHLEAPNKFCEVILKWLNS